MKKIDKWAVTKTQYLYDVNAVEAYKIGAADLRERIYHMIREQDLINAKNIKDNPELARYLLLEIADKVLTFGEEEE